ncbi:SDR family NAD(P)-dependent oxidoreductase [Microbacterium sp. Kw_RZR3]|jgi:NAD(P)-dependent dehydrogenase (short-subunit alcohol dehydrogenase family)|uniref:SDR family NAD(P)-dependent oxidoreductase n=1 Tax=unclassified Microbacterium TaxID=2609290 RepID=UPI0023DB584B|nr:SDR family NAD(P)-dependent oxidoreductase [Microbacterium sp. Kw_RZR3]MDF2046399.1 SDR family NAD(P)-dependent oxidoreductase [Microbacterium sp. Kw_RZR3]MDF2918919.1 dehydrogenase [Microbacterium sp.]
MTTDENQASKVALVTGGNKGIGIAIVRGLAAEGFTVLLGARSIEVGQAAADTLTGDVRPVVLDVTDQGQVDALVAKIAAEFGHLDVLVNNAGVNTLTFHPMDHLPKPTEETVDDIKNVYEVNVFGVVRMINAFLPLLTKADAPRIVNVTSMRGSIGEEGAWTGQPSMVYSSSKTALNALTVHYAREFADSALKINGAAPGHVATEFNNFRGTRTPDEGAAVAVRLATLPADGPTGAVFEDDVQLAW